MEKFDIEEIAKPVPMVGNWEVGEEIAGMRECWNERTNLNNEIRKFE